MAKTGFVKIADEYTDRIIQESIAALVKERIATKKALKTATKVYVEELFQEVISTIAANKANSKDTSVAPNSIFKFNHSNKPPTLTMSTLTVHSSIPEDPAPRSRTSMSPTTK